MASSEHLRVFTGNFITREPSGALCSATPCTGELRFPKVRKAANRASSDAHPSIFGCSPESSDSIGTFGLHTEPPGSRIPIGSSPAVSTNTNPSGLAAHRSCSSEDFGPPTVRYNRHRVSSDTHRNLRIPPESPRDSEATIQSHRLAVIELFHRPSRSRDTSRTVHRLWRQRWSTL